MKRGEWQRVFVENWTNYDQWPIDHIRPCFVKWCRAGGQGEVLASIWTMPIQDSKRFNSVTKTIHFAHLSILFFYAFTTRREWRMDIGQYENLIIMAIIYSLYCMYIVLYSVYCTHTVYFLWQWYSVYILMTIVYTF